MDVDETELISTFLREESDKIPLTKSEEKNDEIPLTKRRKKSEKRKEEESDEKKEEESDDSYDSGIEKENEDNFPIPTKIIEIPKNFNPICKNIGNLFNANIRKRYFLTNLPVIIMQGKHKISHLSASLIKIFLWENLLNDEQKIKLHKNHAHQYKEKHDTDAIRNAKGITLFYINARPKERINNFLIRALQLSFIEGGSPYSIHYPNGLIIKSADK